MTRGRASDPSLSETPAAMEIIAHRGYSARAPENTVAALLAALEAGADAVEFDVQTGVDGIPFLFHDDRLHRTTNARGAVREKSFTELAALDAGSWFGPSFRGEGIPSLAEALGHLRGAQGRIYAEVKALSSASHVEVVAQVVADSGSLDRTVFIAMDWSLLDRMRQAYPEVSVGYIVTDAAQAPTALERARGDSAALVDFDARLVLAAPDLAHRAHDLGVEVAVWTVDDPADATRLAALGVQRITTNQVGRLMAWKASL